MSLRQGQLSHEPPRDRIRDSAEEAANKPPDLRRGLQFTHNCALLHEDVLGGREVVQIHSVLKLNVNRQLQHQAVLSGGTFIIPIRSGGPN